MSDSTDPLDSTRINDSSTTASVYKTPRWRTAAWPPEVGHDWLGYCAAVRDHRTRHFRSKSYLVD